MCDYSLRAVKSRPASVGDKLTTHNFGTGTRGFRATDDVPTTGPATATAVCILPGTRVVAAQNIRAYGPNNEPYDTGRREALFNQENKELEQTHHDVLDFSDGSHIYLTRLVENQDFVVEKLPDAPRTAHEAAAQKRAAFV